MPSATSSPSLRPSPSRVGLGRVELAARSGRLARGRRARRRRCRRAPGRCRASSSRPSGMPSPSVSARSGFGPARRSSSSERPSPSRSSGGAPAARASQSRRDLADERRRCRRASRRRPPAGHDRGDDRRDQQEHAEVLGAVCPRCSRSISPRSRDAELVDQPQRADAAQRRALDAQPAARGLHRRLRAVALERDDDQRGVGRRRRTRPGRPGRPRSP